MQAFYSNTAQQRRDTSPLVDELSALFDSIDDSKLMTRLWQYRWTGRRGYSPRSLWRAVIAGHYLNIGSTIGLTRRLQEDAALLAVCGLRSVPSGLTIGRFFQRLTENMELVDACLTSATRELAARLEGFGERLAVDSTTVTTYANPGREVKSDPDATWMRKPNSQRKLAWHYGYRLHSVCDMTYELPVHHQVLKANINDSLTLVDLVAEARERSGIQPTVVAADAGYGPNQNVEGMIALGAAPVIKRINRRTTSGKWQKPHPRLQVDQKSAEWRSEYASRVAVERLFSRLKGHRALTRHTRRRLAPVSLHCTLAILTMQVSALAQIRLGRVESIRQCARSVA